MSDTLDFDIDLENVTISINGADDNVNHPSHYNQYGVECIDAIRAALGPNFKYYCIGNVMKYTWRHEYKNGLEDLKKAEVYLRWAIEAEEDL